MLEDGTEITVDWDGGGDECIMSVYFDGKEQDYTEHAELSDFVAEVLQIPSVGEFFMKGSGRLFIDGPVVKIDHKSHCSGESWDHIDFDAIPDFDGHSFDWEANVKVVDEERQGITVLFQ